jgi:hypothetical protein
LVEKDVLGGIPLALSIGIFSLIGRDEESLVSTREA